MKTVEVGDGEGLGRLRSGTRCSTNSSKVQQGRWVHPGTEGVSRGTLNKTARMKNLKANEGMQTALQRLPSEEIEYMWPQLHE